MREEVWANMSHQQHNDWRTLQAEFVDHKAAVENPTVLQNDGEHEEAVDNCIFYLGNESSTVTPKRRKDKHRNGTQGNKNAEKISMGVGKHAWYGNRANKWTCDPLLLSETSC